MSRFLCVGIVMCGLICAAGCRTRGGRQGETTGRGEVVREEVEETGQAAADLASTTRERIVRSSEKRVRAFRQQMDKLGRRASEGGERVRRSWDDRIKPQLDRHLQGAQRQLEELRSAPEDAWDGAKQGMLRALERLQDGFREAARRIAGDDGP